MKNPNFDIMLFKKAKAFDVIMKANGNRHILTNKRKGEIYFAVCNGESVKVDKKELALLEELGMDDIYNDTNGEYTQVEMISEV